MEGNNFHSQGRQQLGSSTKVHTALGFLILALLTLLQVKYQNSGNPFQTHGAIMASFIVLVIGYALMLAGISRPTLNTSYLHIGRRMCVILGTSASGLLVEILLPPWRILILAISALMFAQLLCVAHQQILQFFGQIFQSINQSISEAVKTLCGWIQNGFQSLQQAASKAFNCSSMPTANSIESQVENVATSG
ncbi:hypothetical protein ACB092_09G185400 [Castanea dentata]